jgi:hypothetical protein
MQDAEVQFDIIMKTIITLNGEPERLWKWCDMATDVVFFRD